MKYAKLGSLTFLLANADAGLRGPLKAKEATALAGAPQTALAALPEIPKFDISPKFELPRVGDNFNFNRSNDAVPDFKVTPANMEHYNIPKEYHLYDSNDVLHGFYGRNGDTYHDVNDLHYRLEGVERYDDTTGTMQPYVEWKKYADTSLQPELWYDAAGDYLGYVDSNRNFHSRDGRHFEDKGCTGYEYEEYFPYGKDKNRHDDDLRLVSLKNKSYEEHYRTREKYEERFEKPVDETLEVEQPDQNLKQAVDQTLEVKQPDQNLKQADQSRNLDKQAAATALAGAEMFAADLHNIGDLAQKVKAKRMYRTRTTQIDPRIGGVVIGGAALTGGVIAAADSKSDSSEKKK